VTFGVCDGAPVIFEPCLDVPNGGVLCALPALLSNGLLEGAEQFLGRIHGYYTIFHILLFFSFMALCRIKSVERICGQAPDEFGRLLGEIKGPRGHSAPWIGHNECAVSHSAGFKVVLYRPEPNHSFVIVFVLVRHFLFQCFDQSAVIKFIFFIQEKMVFDIAEISGGQALDRFYSINLPV
jgi:hypothetical protein